MKLSILLLVLISFKLSAQEKVYNYDKELDCEFLRNGIIDSVLYEFVDGRLQVKNENFKNNEIKILSVDEKSYYISKRLAELIKKLIKEKGCEAITISSIDKTKKYDIVRDR